MILNKIEPLLSVLLKIVDTHTNGGIVEIPVILWTLDELSQLQNCRTQKHLLSH